MNALAASMAGGLQAHGAEEEEDIDAIEPPVRVLYRTRQGTVTAGGSAVGALLKERKVERESSGWRSRFAQPYRPLGKPLLEIRHPKNKQEKTNRRVGIDNMRIGLRSAGTPSARMKQQTLEALAEEQQEVGPDLYPKHLHYIEEGMRADRSVFKGLRSSVRVAEMRVRACRAGAAVPQLLPNTENQLTVTAANGTAAAGTGAAHAPALANSSTSSNTRTAAAPAVPTLDMTKVTAQGGSQAPKPPPPRAAGARSSGSVTSRTGRTLSMAAATSSAHASGAQTARTAVSSGSHGHTSKVPKDPPAKMPKKGPLSRQEALQVILGHTSSAYPVPELNYISENFRSSARNLAGRLEVTLDKQNNDRLDTYRRKFVAFGNGEGSADANNQLNSMRLHAERERLKTSLRLYENRKWFSKLHDIITGDNVVSPAEQFLLNRVKRVVEEGVIFSKDTVLELMKLFKHPQRIEAFSSPAIQDIFKFLCTRFGVPDTMYDAWVLKEALPEPQETLDRADLARKKRRLLFCQPLVKRHWQEKLEIMELTKDAEYWLPDEILNTLTQEQAAEGVDAQESLDSQQHMSSGLDGDEMKQQALTDRPGSSLMEEADLPSPALRASEQPLES